MQARHGALIPEPGQCRPSASMAPHQNHSHFRRSPSTSNCRCRKRQGSHCTNRHPPRTECTRAPGTGRFPQPHNSYRRSSSSSYRCRSYRHASQHKCTLPPEPIPRQPGKQSARSGSTFCSWSALQVKIGQDRASNLARPLRIGSLKHSNSSAKQKKKQ